MGVGSLWPRNQGGSSIDIIIEHIMNDLGDE
jgi:hypothetical protein